MKEMLCAEREYLAANRTLWVLMALVVPASLVYGLVAIKAPILVKIGWTFVFGTEAGAMSHLSAALLGLAVCDALILYIRHKI